MGIDRRSFIGASTAAVAGTVLLSAPAIAKGKKHLRMVTSWPKNFPGLGVAPERAAEIIENLSQGKYHIKIFAGGELVHPLKCLDAVEEGAADLFHSAGYYYTGKSKAFAFFASVPLGLMEMEMDAWFKYGGGQELADKVAADFNVKMLPCGITGVQMGGWYSKYINTIEDLKGLKIRMPGLGGDVLSELGSTTITLPGSEILTALQSGAIDAAEWVGPWNDLAFGFYKVVKNYYYPGFQEPGSLLTMGISRKFWESLDEHDKMIFKVACSQAQAECIASYYANDGKSLVTLQKDHDVKLIKFSDKVFTGFAEASKDVVAKVGNSDGTSKEVYDSFMKFRRDMMKILDITVLAYGAGRKLVDFD